MSALTQLCRVWSTTWVSRWNFTDMPFRSRGTIYFRFTSAISISGTWSMSSNVDINAVELDMVEHVSYPLEFHRYLVPFLRYNVLPVYRLPFPFPILGRCRAMSALTQLSWAWSKLWVIRWNFTDTSFRSWNTMFFRFTSAISVSGTWSMSGNVGANTVELGMVENVGYPLEFHRYLIPFLRYNVLPVYGPPFPFPVFCRCRAMLTLTQLSWVWSKMWVTRWSFTDILFCSRDTNDLFG
jgi:hypothetical protein